MNITRSNWNQLLPFMKETLKKADLVSIDFEMTGVQASPLLRNSVLDSMQLRYWKSKENVSRFLPLQIGICAFQVKDSKTVEAYPFNIYLYPFTGHDYLDKTYFFSSGAVQFLASHNFDFNRTFYDGVPYLSRESEQMFRENKKMLEIKEGLKKMNKSLDPDMLDFLHKHLQEIIEYFASDSEKLIIDIKMVKVRSYKYLLEQIKFLPKIQAFHIVFDSQSLNKRTQMTIIKGKGKSDRKVEINDEIDPVGVRHLIDQLVEQKTPLLLHNGLTDLCQLYDKFIYSLPGDQEQFKRQVQKEFPVIYDTKYMINSSNILFNQVKQFSELKNSFEQLKEFKDTVPRVVINEDFSEYQLHPEHSDDQVPNSFEHEAGYDALMTGYIFLKSAALILNGKNTTKNSFLLDHERLKFYKNRLPLGSVKIPFNLEDVDDKYHEQTTQIFYMSQVQKELIQSSKVKDYFQVNNLGGINLFLSYGQNFEYFMTFEQQYLVEEFMKILIDGSTIIEVDGKSIIVMTYENYQEQVKVRVRDELDIRGMPLCLEKVAKY